MTPTAAKKAPAKKPAAKKAPAKKAPAKKAPGATAASKRTAAKPSGPPAIEAIGLTRSFKGGVDAVRGVDLTVQPGEIFGFLGPNGAGKSTTIRMLCTLLPPTGGTAKVLGFDVTKQQAQIRKRIGVALQEAGLDPLQTGRELLRLQSALYGLPDPDKRATELLELLGLTDAADRRTKTYSGGMKRRLDLATGLVHQPDVLFLDEPTTGLDPASRVDVWNEVREINGRGTTIFLTTQYLEEADNLCDRIAIIDGGLLVAEGTPAELKAEIGVDVVHISLGAADAAATQQAIGRLPGLRKVVADRGAVDLHIEDGAAAVPILLRTLERKGISVGAVSVSRPTLDDVFLQATGRRLDVTDEQQKEDE